MPVRRPCAAVPCLLPCPPEGFGPGPHVMTRSTSCCSDHVNVGSFTQRMADPGRWRRPFLQVVYERLWDAVWVHPQEVIDEGAMQ